MSFRLWTAGRVQASARKFVELLMALGSLAAVSLAACVNDAPGQELGFETGRCLDGQCFGGLSCLSDLCVDAGASQGEDTAGSDTAGSDTTGGPEETGGGTQGDPGTGSTTAGVSTAASTSDATSTTTGDNAETSGGQVEPASCSDDADCESGVCYFTAVLGGICGECLDDGDCPDGGCSPPNPLAMPPLGAFCNMGELGAGCTIDASCSGGLVCAQILSIPGVLTTSTCSECEATPDCGAGQICNPFLDLAALTGVKTCTGPGTVALGEGCTPGAEGNAACASGACAVADVMGLFEIGVCSECIDSGDCPIDQTCSPPMVDLARGSTTAGACG